MLEIFAIAAALAFVVAVFSFAAAAGYTIIALIAGAGIGGFAVLVVGISISDRRQEREERRRAMDHRRMLELLSAAQGRPIVTIDQQKRDVPRIAKW